MRDAIATGELELGYRLLGARDLAGQMGISLLTVLHAYADLRTEGIVEVRRGRRAIIAGGTARHHDLDDLLDRAIALAQEAQQTPSDNSRGIHMTMHLSRPQRRNVGAGIAALALALPLAAVVSTANAPAFAGAAPACSTNSAALSGFVGEGNRPLAAAPVTLYADPDLSKLKIGQSAGLIKLGTAKTSRDGCFQIPTNAKWSRAAEAGTLNVRVFIRRPTQLELRVVPLRVSKTGSGARQVSRVAPDLASARAAGPVLERFTGTEAVTTAAAASVAKDAAVATGRLAAGQVKPSTTQAASAFLHDPDAAQRSGQIRWVKRADYGKRPVLIGQWWSTNPGVVQRWIYSKGASSSLEAAFTLAGEGGEYKHSSMESKSSNRTIGFPIVKGNAGKYFRTYFAYGKYDLQQFEYTTGRWYYLGSWVRATSWEGGTQVTSGVPVPAVKAINCSLYLKGSFDETSVSKAMTWTDGVQLSAPMKHVLGSVSLSSQTGFTASATNHVEFETRGGHLCGRFGPLSRPGALMARK